MTDQLGCDVSNYDNDIGPLLNAHPEWQRIVVRCSLDSAALSAITRQQCQTVRDRGRGLDVYVWAYPDTDDPVAVADAALALASPFSPDIYWIDCEDTGHFYADAASNIDWLRRLIAAFQGCGARPAIYSGHWFWTSPQMGNTDAFSALPLWAATDTKVPDRSQGWEFGGWVHPFAAVQYDLSGPDLDCFDAALYAGGNDLSVEERAYYDTLLGTPDNPGGLIGVALDTLTDAAQTAQRQPSKAAASKLAGVVLGQVQAVRQAAGI